MPRRILRDVPLVRLDLGDGDWVKIRSKFTMADRAAINEAIVEGGIVTSSRRPTKAGEEGQEQHPSDDGMTRTEMGRQLTIGRSNLVTLERGIAEWGGPGFCAHDHDDGTQHFDDDENNGCKPVKITEASIAQLDDSTGRRILDEINRRNPQATSEEEDPNR